LRNRTLEIVSLRVQQRIAACFRCCFDAKLKICEQSIAAAWFRLCQAIEKFLGSSTFLVGKADKIGFSGGDDTGENVSTDIGVGRSLAREPYGLR
jgi:hypothetical protein